MRFLTTRNLLLLIIGLSVLWVIVWFGLTWLK